MLLSDTNPLTDALELFEAGKLDELREYCATLYPHERQFIETQFLAAPGTYAQFIAWWVASPYAEVMFLVFAGMLVKLVQMESE